MDGRKEGEPPFTLLDFFPEDSLNLTHGHVTFINHDKEIFWEEIKQGHHKVVSENDSV